MAEGIVSKPAYVDTLVQALAAALPNAQVDDQKIRGDRYRFIVIDSSFDGTDHPQRQRVVWDIAERALPRSDLTNVGMIITMAPSEVG